MRTIALIVGWWLIISNCYAAGLAMATLQRAGDFIPMVFTVGVVLRLLFAFGGYAVIRSLRKEGS